VNSKAYRAVSSAQSKRYFARKKSWLQSQTDKSAFIPAQKRPLNPNPHPQPLLPAQSKEG
jgi:hypothetical protein